jgi:hypothetical protein
LKKPQKVTEKIVTKESLEKNKGDNKTVEESIEKNSN